LLSGFLWGEERLGFLDLGQPGRESGLDHLGICRRELVFQQKRPLCPGGKSLCANDTSWLAASAIGS
jgi:hypothetical protein